MTVTRLPGDRATGPQATGAGPANLDVAIRLVRGDFVLAVELILEPGVTVIIGPNGAGKSSLLHTIAGVVVAEPSGHVRLGGRTLADSGHSMPLHERRLGLMFQDPVLLPHRSLLDNVAMACAAGRRPSRQHRGAALQGLARVGIDPVVARARPAGVSGGQAQRAALARALATRPEAMLLDEPLAAVDATGRQDLRGLLRHQLRDFPGPSVVVSHDLADVATLADRVIVVEHGQVTADNDLATLAARPSSSFVADLVGMNLYRATAAGTTAWVTTSDDSNGHVEVVTAEAATGDVHIAFPPRAVALYRTRPDGSPRNTFMVRVQRIDTIADRLRVHLAGDLAMVAEVTATAATALDLAEEVDLHAVVKATEIVVYPR